MDRRVFLIPEALSVEVEDLELEFCLFETVSAKRIRIDNLHFVIVDSLTDLIFVFSNFFANKSKNMAMKVDNLFVLIVF